MISRIVGSIIIVACVLAVGAALAFTKYREINIQQNQPPRPEAADVVGIVTAKYATIRETTTSIGTILAPQSVRLRNELVGTIKSISMESGSLVEKNDLLVQFDTSVEDAMLASAQATNRIAESTYRRLSQASRSSDAVSQLELEQGEATLAQARAEIQRLTAMIQKKTLRAPFRSRVGLFDSHIGQYLSEGTEIVVLQGIDEFVNVDFAMPQNVADYVSVGDRIRLRTATGNVEARIAAIDSQADKLTRGINARARIDHPPASLQPNDSVKVELEYGLVLEGVALPASAIRRSPAGTFVFVVREFDKGEMRATMRTVKLGRSQGNSVLVLQGVAPEEVVVSDGSFKLQENSLIKPYVPDSTPNQVESSGSMDVPVASGASAQ